MTKKTKLESYVQVRFGTDLYEFIKQKVQVDEFYDYEIASLLEVSDSMITSLRNAYGIKRATGFSRRFDRRYGKGAVERFKAMAENPNSTLDDIGRHFEFSKEYARQVYKNIYGYAYTEAYKRKRLIKKKRGLSERTKRSKQSGDLTKVSKRMKPMGFGKEPILARIMTTKEVAKYLKLHEISVNKYATKGEIPAVRIGRAWRFDKEAIDKWINAGQKKAIQKAKKESRSDTDPNIIKKSRKGTRSATLKKKAEVKDDNQRPVIYKLRKKAKIKSERRGVYIKA
jgi:PTS system nitrogen regulatory IIA component